MSIIDSNKIKLIKTGSLKFTVLWIILRAIKSYNGQRIIIILKFTANLTIVIEIIAILIIITRIKVFIELVFRKNCWSWLIKAIKFIKNFNIQPRVIIKKTIKEILIWNYKNWTLKWYSMILLMQCIRLAKIIIFEN